jgi:small-conductance mechanosensitive channel
MGLAGAAEGPEPQTLAMWNRPIVTFRVTVAGNTPAQRVTNSRARIDALSDSDRLQPIGSYEAKVANIEGVIVTVGQKAVFALLQGDVDPESGMTLAQLVERSRTQLAAVIAAQNQQNKVPMLLRGAGLTFAASLLLVGLVWLIRSSQKFGVRKLDAMLRHLNFVIGGIDIAPTLATVERAILRVVGWALIVAMIYLWLVFVLQQFPYTVPLGLRLGAYLRDQFADAGVSAIRALPEMALVVAVVLITRAIAVWISRLLAEVEQGARSISWIKSGQARATRRIAVGFLWAVGIVIAYSLLPWSSNVIFQGISVVFGVALSLASTGLVNQWISGLVILYSRSFEIGDVIAIGDTEGVVTELGPLATRLRTVRREEITLPNAVLVSGKLTNYTRFGEGSGALLNVQLSVGYNVPWQKVRALLLQGAAHTSGLRADPPPRVLQVELSDFSVSYQLHVCLELAESRVAVRSELNSRILDAFAAAGVQIMTPHFESQPSTPVVAPSSATPFAL